MSSAFFKKPGDDSSETSSEEDEEIEDLSPSRQRSADAVEDGELGGTESLSSNASFSIGDSQDDRTLPNIDQHRNLMLATLLEDYYKTRAAELINSTTPGANYHRLSPEVQALARKLYAEASETLAANGLLSSATTSTGLQNVRRQYLSGLDNLSLRKIQDGDLFPAQSKRQLQDTDNSLAIVRADRRGSHEVIDVLDEPTSSLIMRTGRIGVSSPHSGMPLSFTQIRRSHYESSFQQLKLLGKGGFGKVYHAFNVFDKKEYAVKKIPLSPRLSQRYKESGHQHQELESVLREVQALAHLDHSNVVRYHATWIEEPQSLPTPAYTPAKPRFAMPQQRLLEHHPPPSPHPNTLKPPPVRVTAPEHSDGIVFGSDSVSNSRPNDLRDWSSQNLLHDSASARESEIFTDGHARASLPADTAIEDLSVYVLHVQMSMYPLTLAQYLSPPPLNSTSGLNHPIRRHCFHLVPALRILLGILCGLQYIHANGLIHRDIKPSNIFISSTTFATHLLVSDGFYDVGSCASCPEANEHHVNPRIGDFGLVAELARSAHADPSRDSPGSSRAVGTEFYRPPPWTGEHDDTVSSPKSKSNLRPPMRDQVDEKVDVFALGVILVEMLWRCATSSERVHVLKDLQRMRLPKGLGANIDAEGHAHGTGELVEECVRGMIERDPRKRWSCTRVKEQIQAMLGGCRLRGRDAHGDGCGGEGFGKSEELDRG